MLAGFPFFSSSGSLSFMMHNNSVAPRLLSSSGVLDLKNQSKLLSCQQVSTRIHQHSVAPVPKINHLPEQRPFTDIPLDQFIAIISVDPMVVHPDHQETVLFLGIGLALVLSVLEFELLHRIFE